MSDIVQEEVKRLLDGAKNDLRELDKLTISKRSESPIFEMGRIVRLRKVLQEAKEILKY